MGCPERLLKDDEVIESQFRPHWSGILREGLIKQRVQSLIYKAREIRMAQMESGQS